MSQAEPLVTVICTTYNHGAYIRETLEGFLIQECDYPFEILIHDDASTDNTASVIREYAGKYPSLFRTILQTENQYSQGTDIWSMLITGHSSARYIAFCEGDDYWTDPHKLQVQIAYMEAHPECGLTYTRAQIFDQQSNRFGSLIGGPGETLRSILCSNPIPTLTTMFRRELYADYIDRIPGIRLQWRMADYPLWLYISTCRDVHFIPLTTGIYRRLPESASNSKDTNKRIGFLHNADWIKRFFAKRYAADLLDAVEQSSIYELLEIATRGRHMDELRSLRKRILILHRKGHNNPRLKFSLILSYSPGLYTGILRAARTLKRIHRRRSLQ